MKSQSKHAPWEIGERKFTGYNDYQEALWNAFNDAYHAAVGGYEKCRQPSPFTVFDEARLEVWKDKVVNAWAYEAGSRDKKTKGMKWEDYPENLWYYLYERMVAADGLKLPAS
ncbi:MAG: hypothetical protein GWN86_07000 [Desulfobacterales bacterium]|nr:hypothetical protein [Desulfobacterales bacterium]